MEQQILFVNVPNEKPLPDPSGLRVSADPHEITMVTTIDEALHVIESKEQIDVVVSNEPSIDLYRGFRSRNENGKGVLLTSQSFEDYSHAFQDLEFDFLDHVITNRDPQDWTVNELRITLQKLLRRDLFGLDKYFKNLTNYQKKKISPNSSRVSYLQSVASFIRENKLGRTLATVGYSISEELIMNALYDAPEAAGMTLTRESRSDNVDLPSELCPSLDFGFDGTTLGIAVRDPFGAMQRDKYFEYLKKVVKRDDATELVDEKESGAGLGLYKILFNSHVVICNVDPQKLTEVIVLIDTRYQARSAVKIARSIHFFCEKKS